MINKKKYFDKWLKDKFEVNKKIRDKIFKLKK